MQKQSADAIQHFSSALKLFQQAVPIPELSIFSTLYARGNAYATVVSRTRLTFLYLSNCRSFIQRAHRLAYDDFTAAIDLLVTSMEEEKPLDVPPAKHADLMHARAMTQALVRLHNISILTISSLLLDG